MENYFLTDIYNGMRLRNMERMMELVCKEIDSMRLGREASLMFGGMGSIAPPVVSIAPLLISIAIKFVLFLGVFLVFLWDSFSVQHFVVEEVSDGESIPDTSNEKTEAEA